MPAHNVSSVMARNGVTVHHLDTALFKAVLAGALPAQTASNSSLIMSRVCKELPADTFELTLGR